MDDYVVVAMLKVETHLTFGCPACNSRHRDKRRRVGTGRVLISCPPARLPFSQFHPFSFLLLFDGRSSHSGYFNVCQIGSSFQAPSFLPRDYSAAPFYNPSTRFQRKQFWNNKAPACRAPPPRLFFFPLHGRKVFCSRLGGRVGGKHFGSRRERNNSRTESSQPATFPSIHPSGPVVWPKDICCALVVVETGTKESTLDDAAGWMGGWKGIFNPTSYLFLKTANQKFPSFLILPS